MKMDGTELNGVDLTQNDATDTVETIALDGHVLAPGSYRRYWGKLVKKATGGEAKEIIVIDDEVIFLGFEVCKTDKTGAIIETNYRRLTPCNHGAMEPVMLPRKKREGGGLQEHHRVCSVCHYSTEPANKPPRGIY